MKSLVNINTTTASFTSSGRLNSYGLCEAIKAIPPSVLSMPAANTLLRVCADACASSGYKLFKSIGTMSRETYQSENTVRSHLKLAVKSGILTRREVFKSGRQMTNEYTFTKAFLVAASKFRQHADTTRKSAQEQFEKLLSGFLKALLALTSRLFSDSKKAPQKLIPRGSRNCTQLLVSSDHQKKNNIPEEDSSIFAYRDEPDNAPVEFDDVRRQRTAVQNHDAGQHKQLRCLEQTAIHELISKAAVKRAVGWVKAKTSGKPKSTGAASTSFNHGRFEQANREFDQTYQDLPSREQSRAIGQQRLAEIRKKLNSI